MAPTTLTMSANDAAARIFVGDSRAKAGTGSNGLQHAAGVRSADDSDDASTDVLNANGDGLALSLDKWRAATGSAQWTHLDNGHDRVTFTFHNVIAFGSYSVFVADLNNPDSAALLALDGSGTANNFTAAEDGTASLDVTTQQPLTNEEALVLVYHSDDMDHGPAPGTLGIDAHEQIITHL